MLIGIFLSQPIHISVAMCHGILPFDDPFSCATQDSVRYAGWVFPQLTTLRETACSRTPKPYCAPTPGRTRPKTHHLSSSGFSVTAPPWKMASHGKRLPGENGYRLLFCHERYHSLRALRGAPLSDDGPKALPMPFDSLSVRSQAPSVSRIVGKIDRHPIQDFDEWLLGSQDSGTSTFMYV